MRIAIVHYHLNPGGVTRVIENAVTSLVERGIDCVVLTGEPYAGESIKAVQYVEGLEYDARGEPVASEKLAANMFEAARKQFVGKLPDIWHFHNHALGKNLALPGAIKTLIANNQRILLQIHDFAEDGRPDNYHVIRSHYGNHNEADMAHALYPCAPQIQYAVLNVRDRNFLQNAGVPPDRVHLLANPVALPSVSDGSSVAADKLGAGPLILYPTRAIRRKNLGEFILWAALDKEAGCYAINLAPENPIDRKIHDRWQSFATGLNLPVQFNINERYGFTYPAIAREAHALFTTSMAEGFGLTFLEPALLGKPLIGRNLPEITGDFSDHGIDLSALYTRLMAPIELIGRDRLTQELARALTLYYEAYATALPSNAVECVLNAISEHDRVDFGCLNEVMQESVIEQMVQSPPLRDDIQPLAPGSLQSQTTIAANRQIIEKEYNLEKYGDTLTGLYRNLLEAPAEKPGALDYKKLLACFLDPARFCLLRT